MIEIDAKVLGIENVQAKIGAWGKDGEKAMNRAIRIEGFKLRQRLMQAIRAGQPMFGIHLNKLSEIAKAAGKKMGRKKAPLYNLANAITYDVNNQSNTVSIGFTQRSPIRVQKIALRQQRGFESKITDQERRKLLAVAFQSVMGKLVKAKRKSIRDLDWQYRVLFLRKSTTTLKTQPRPFVAPFWRHEQPGSISNIKNNFKSLMSGNRVE